MIHGMVSPNLEMLLPFGLPHVNGDVHEYTAPIDSGFSGMLTLPAELVAQTHAEWLGREEGALADGSITVFEVFRARIIWDGKPQSVELQLVEGCPLIGTLLLEGFDLAARFVANGTVELNRA